MPMRKTSLFVLLTLFASRRAIALESLAVKLGYGMAWTFFNNISSTYSPTTYTGTGTESTGSIAVGDIIAIGGDLRITPKHGVSAMLNFGGPYAYFHSLNFAASYKYFLFDWYNQLFIGAGADYLRVYTSDNLGTNRVAAHLAYGLNIQFPENIFIIVDFRNIFFAPVWNSSQKEELTHIFQLIGSVSYRIPLR